MALGGCACARARRYKPYYEWSFPSTLFERLMWQLLSCNPKSAGMRLPVVDRVGTKFTTNPTAVGLTAYLPSTAALALVVPSLAHPPYTALGA